MCDISPIQVPIETDEKGFYDRQCPNPECQFLYKIKLEDWIEKVSSETVFCPQCGHRADSDSWFTETQIERIREIALSAAMGWVYDELGAVMDRAERDTRRNRYFKITYKPGPRPTVLELPIEQLPEWETELMCPDCGTTFSVIGTAHFYPCCGKTLLVSTYASMLAAKVRQLNSLDTILS